MRYGSVCSGIEAASVAWRSFGWEAQFLSEIEAAPRAILSHHYDQVPLHGDFTTIREGQYGSIDLLVGGTPCQSFSVAGLRGGLADDRGNLALQYLRLAQRLGPRWLVWENVPGVLSSGGGRDFGAILGGMVELGYGFAYRVLDAQYVRVDGFGRAVPQRRRRVFVVGHLGDWRRAAAVFFERACLRGDLAPRRSTGPSPSSAASSSIGAGGSGAGRTTDRRSAAQAFGGGQNCNPTDVSTALSAHPGGRYDLDNETFVAQTLLSGGHSNNPLDENLVAFDTTQITSAANRSAPQPGDPCHPLAAEVHPPAIAFNSRQDPDVTWDRAGSLGSSSPQAEAVAFQVSESGVRVGDVHATLDANNGPRRHNGVLQGWAVRRLTPLECERLQGFPDGYTAVPYRGGILSDGPRYKALGNSMAVNAMRWIGQRIQAVEAIPSLSPAPVGAGRSS